MVATFGAEHAALVLSALGFAVLAIHAIRGRGQIMRWVGGGLAVAAVLVLGAVALDRSATGDGGSCFPGSPDLASSKQPRWAATDRRSNKKILIALYHYVNEKGKGSAFIPIVATPRNRRNKPLPRKARIGAFVLGGTVSDGSRDIGFPVAARAKRSRDGRGVHVTVCTVRPKKRRVSRPGRYTGTVRVAGPELTSFDVPVEVTIKAAQTELIALVLFGALLGALLGGGNAREVGVSSEDVKKEGANAAANAGRQAANEVLRLVPFLSGIAAGVIAGFAVYADDATFGANRGADTAKLLAITFTAATGGLTVAAPPARAVRNRLKR